ncbi:MAG TPA: hypothetical protein VNT30_25775 [Stellaceae bacterium]|nr:hypothetical protein [Stellaceae bacterium]
MSRYLLSLIEQGAASLINLGLNLLLIRLVGAGEYGAFIFWSNAGLILNSVQNALTACHVVVLPPGAEARAARVIPERILLSVSVLFALLAALGTLLAIVLLRRTGSILAIWPVVAFVPAFLLQQYARSLAFSRAAPGIAASLTVSVLVLGGALLIAAYLAGIHLDAGHALAILAIAYGGVAVIGLWRLDGGGGVAFDRATLAAYRPYLTDSRWVLLGASTTELLSRFYGFIVIAWFGAVALGTLSAAQLLLRPMVLLVNAWSPVARAAMANARERGDWPGFRHHMLRAVVANLVFGVPWTVAVFLAWPLISEYLYKGAYADAAPIALLWGVSSILGGFQVIPNIGLQVLRAFRLLSYANLAAALSAVGSITLLLGLFAYPAAVVGTMVGQCVEIGLMVVFLARLVPPRMSAGVTATP